MLSVGTVRVNHEHPLVVAVVVSVGIRVAVNCNCYGDANDCGCATQSPGACHGEFGGDSVLYPQGR